MEISIVKIAELIGEQKLEVIIPGDMSLLNAIKTLQSIKVQVTEALLKQVDEKKISLKDIETISNIVFNDLPIKNN